MSAHPDDYDQRVLTNLTWLAVNLPGIVAAQCPTGDDITAVTIYGSEVRIQMDRLDVAERIAEHLSLANHDKRTAETGKMHHEWSGYCGDVLVSVVAIEQQPAVA